MLFVYVLWLFPCLVFDVQQHRIHTIYSSVVAVFLSKKRHPLLVLSWDLAKSLAENGKIFKKVGVGVLGRERTTKDRRRLAVGAEHGQTAFILGEPHRAKPVAIVIMVETHAAARKRAVFF